MRRAVVLTAVLLWFLCTICSSVNVRKLKKLRGEHNPHDQRVKDEVDSLADDISRHGRDRSNMDSRGNQLKKGGERRNKRGDRTTRMKQFYRDIPVFGYEIVENEIQEGEVELLDKETGNPTGKRRIANATRRGGKFIDGLNDEIGTVDRTHFDPQRAIRSGKDHVKRRRGKQQLSTTSEQADLVIYINETDGSAIVAQHVQLEVNDPQQPSRPNMLIDKDGNVLKMWDAIKNATATVVTQGTGPGGNSRAGTYRYGTQKPMLQVTKSGTTCSYSTPAVKTINLRNLWSTTSTTAHTYPCYEQGNDAMNGGASPMNDAHAFGTAVMDLYKQWYSAMPPSLPSPLLMKVHYGSGYENAYWDGEAMVFGDGGQQFYPLVALDVTAHEIGHGVTDGASQLVYSGQSGGVNEAFSDMAGKAAERFLLSKTGVNWGIGASITKNGRPLRCMDNPPCDGRSIANARDYYSGMDVHYSSGVFNKAFYLMAQKFKFDVWDAFDVFYTANVRHWTPTSRFDDAAEGVLYSIEDLRNGLYLGYNYTHLNIQDAVNAFSQVGITCAKEGTMWNCAV